jgi:periplasmic protein TonB
MQGNVVPFAFDKAASGNRRAPGRAPVEMAKVPVLPKAPKRESRKILIATIIVSAAVHAAAIASVMSGDAGEQFGMLSSKVDTFSLATTQSIVLESISSHDVDMASAASADSQAGSVQSAESAPQELTEVKETPLTDEPPPKPIKVSYVTPSALAPTDEPLPVLRGGGEPDAASAIKAEEISEKPVEEMPEDAETKEDAAAKAKREKKVEKERKIKRAQAHEQVAGSSASRSTTAHAAVDGRVSASAGNALSYAAGVRAKVERHKPSGNGLRGTVRVSFGIGASGELTYVRLSGTSGSAKLDEVALEAVRRAAPFGAPSGLSPSQLSYVIPFFFR